MSKSEFKHLFNFAIIAFAGVVFLAVVGLTYLGMYCAESKSQLLYCAISNSCHSFLLIKKHIFENVVL